ncbi:hypothetical protein Bca4012_061006 [Brassica carinata]
MTSEATVNLILCYSLLLFLGIVKVFEVRIGFFFFCNTKSALVQHTIPRISHSLTGRRSASLTPSLYRWQLMLIGNSHDGASDNYFHSTGSDYEPLIAAFFQTFPQHSIILNKPYFA